MARRRRKMTDGELVKILREEIESAEGYDSDNLASNRQKAMDYYLGRKRGDEMPGRSQVQSLDVADMVEAVMSELMPMIENDDLAVFIPSGPDDIDQAALESDAVNHMIMGSNDGYMLFESAFHSALLQRNGWGQVWIEEKETAKTTKLEGLDAVAAQQAVSVDDPNTEVEVLDVEGPWDNVDLTIRTTVTSRTLKVEPIDPTLMLFEKNHDSLSLDGIRFIAKRDFPTRTDLILEGHPKKKVYELPATTLDTKNDTNARNRNEDPQKDAPDPAMDYLERYCCYQLVDFDGDGIAELRYCEIVDRTLLVNEEAERRPFATGTPFPQPHRLNGLSLYDKLKEIQDIKTATLRNYLDNMRENNYPLVGARRESVDPDDIINRRPGGVIPCDDPATDLAPITVADTGGSNIQLLDYADKMRSERGGAALDMQSAEAQIAGDTAHGVERQYSAKEKLAGRMGRNLAKTLVKNLFLLTHATMRTMRGEQTIPRGAGFATIDPTQWRERDAVIVKTGMTLAERNQLLNAINAVYREQKELIAMGQEGILTSLPQAYNALVDMTRAAGVDDPHRYWTDPMSDPAKERRQQNEAAAEQAAQEQRQQTQMLAAIQYDIERMKVVEDRFEARLDAVIELIKVDADMQEKEAELVASAVTQLELAAAQDEGEDNEPPGEGEAAAG